MEVFNTYEDKLLKKYWENNTGTLFKEVKIAGRKRIDGILVTKGDKKAYPRKKFDRGKLKNNLEENNIEIIEVKENLNRNVIGQVEVAKFFIEKKYNPKNISLVVICNKSNSQLKKYCDFKGIKVVEFRGVKNNYKETSGINRVAKLLKNKRELYHAQDLSVLWGVKNRNSLNTIISRYVKNGYLNRIHKGFYSTKPVKEIDPVKLGLKSLRRWAYLSTESVLVNKGIIFQDIKYITLVSNVSRKFSIAGYDYRVRQMKWEHLYNETGIKNKRASLERAVADMLYYNDNYYFDGSSRIDWDKVDEIKKKIGYKYNIKGAD